MCTILVNHNFREHFFGSPEHSLLVGPIQNSLANSVESDLICTALGYFVHMIKT